MRGCSAPRPRPLKTPRSPRPARINVTEASARAHQRRHYEDLTLSNEWLDVTCRAVVWSFARGAQILRYEVTREGAFGYYRLVITYPDGSESVQQVQEPSELSDRTEALMNQLREDGWELI